MSYISPIHLFELNSPGEESIRQITKAVEDEKITYAYEYVSHLGINVDKECSGLSKLTTLTRRRKTHDPLRIY